MINPGAIVAIMAAQQTSLNFMRQSQERQKKKKKEEEKEKEKESFAVIYEKTKNNS